MSIYKSILVASAMVMVSSAVNAQSYYDDDIYYDASKEKKSHVDKKGAKKGKTKSDVQYVTTSDGTTYIIDDDGMAYPTTVANIPGSDLYSVYTDNNRDVDEYNRRYVDNSVVADSLVRDDFANTRKIEKFSNPDIVSGSGDNDLIAYYNQSQPEVNIIVTGPHYYDWGLYPYYYNSWAWDPWYPRPAWSFGYYSYSPYWTSSWYWGPTWYPSWGWGPCWAWDAPHRPYRPLPPTSSGAYRPNGGGYASAVTGGYRGQGSSISSRPSSVNGGFRGNGGTSVRPGGADRTPASVTNGSRPSSSFGGRRPTQGSIGNVVSSSNSSNRGSNTVYRGSATQNNSNSGSFNHNSSGTRYNSTSSGSNSGSYRGSTSSGGFSGGRGSSGSVRSSGGGGGGRTGRH